MAVLIVISSTLCAELYVQINLGILSNTSSVMNNRASCMRNLYTIRTLFANKHKVSQTKPCITTGI